MLKKTAYWINRVLWAALVSGVVLVAVYVSVGRYYIGYVEKQQQQLVQRFVDFSDLPITVGSLSGRWSKLSPVITMEKMALYGPEGVSSVDPVLTLEKVSFQLAPFKSILSGALQVKRLQISGVNCSLEEIQPGKWQLRGYPIAEGGSSDFDNIIDLVLSVEGAELSNAVIAMHNFNGESALLNVDELALLRADDFRRLRVLASIDDADHPLSAIVETEGDPRDLDDFSARAHLKLDDMDFSAQLPALRSLGIDLQDARVDSEIWLDWLPQTVISVQGKVSIPLLDIAAISGEALEPVENLQFRFKAKKTATDDWVAWVPQVQAKWREQSFDFKQLILALDADTVTISLPRLSLDTLTAQIIGLDVLKGNGLAAFSDLSPAGELNNIHLSISRAMTSDAKTSDAKTSDNAPKEGAQTMETQIVAAPKREAFTLVASLNQVSISPWKGAPGATGVSGYIEATPSTGLVDLDTRNLTLDFPSIYHQPLKFTKAMAQVGWSVGERVIVESGPINLEIEKGTATGLLSLDLPVSQDDVSDPLMTLSIGIKNIDAKHRNLLIPYFLNQDFLDWMAGAVPKGHVLEAGFIYRGSLSEGAEEEKTVQLYVDVEDTRLDYHPDWPPLNDISAHVLVEDTSVLVNAPQAKMFGLDISSTKVTTTPLADGGMWLTVDANAQGPARDAMRIVLESAIHSIVGSVFDNWLLDGNTRAQIQLGIPLAGSKRELDLNVKVDFSNARLQIPDYKLKFTDLSGPLLYSSDKGISSSGIEARLYEKPLQVKISSGPENAVDVDLRGRIDMADVENWTRQPALMFVSGETDFRAQLAVIPKGNSELTISSDMLGVTIDLPSPYSKTPQQPNLFWLTLPLTSSRALLKMGLSDWASLQLQLDEGSLESGLAILDHSDNKQHDLGFFVLTGRVEDFKISEWQPVLDRYVAKVDAQQAEGEALPIRVRELLLDRFTGFGQSFSDSYINIERKQNSWWLKGRNTVFDGELIFPDDTVTPLVIDLRRLSLPAASDKQLAVVQSGDDTFSANHTNEKQANEKQANEKQAGVDEPGTGQTSTDQSSEDLASDHPSKESPASQAPPTEAADNFDPENLGSLIADVNIDALSVGVEQYGQLSFKLRPYSGGLRLNELRGKVRGVDIGGDNGATLFWWRDEQGEHSRFGGDFDLQDVGDVMESWHYERIVESERGWLSTQLQWSGRPDQWQLQQSTGSIDLRFRNGRFLKASEAASGTLKVVGIINLTNVVRRLQLDFSDVYESGISFDRIDGRLELANADLYIVDKLVVESPSSGFSLLGSADLEHELLDMELIVTLPVVSNLPWIAALAGGLPTAAGVYVASKIFEDQFDRLSSAVYLVKGDWNEPELKFKQVFDTSKKSKPPVASKSSAEPSTFEAKPSEAIPPEVEAKGPSPTGVKRTTIPEQTSEGSVLVPEDTEIRLEETQ